MGILDSITGQSSSVTPDTRTILVTALMSILANQSKGGLAGLIQKFTGSGLGDLVNSWVSPGENKPITAQEVQQGLGQDTINQLSAKTGISPEEVKTHLTQVLPQVVDRLTPGGQVPPHDDILSKGMDMLKGLF